MTAGPPKMRAMILSIKLALSTLSLGLVLACGGSEEP
ncbi:MAG: hypothetical protein ACI9MR_002714, partial [Myxococcota bacterium]